MTSKNRKLTPNNDKHFCFSATMPTAIRELAEMFLKDPETIVFHQFHQRLKMWNNGIFC
jgi:superfamily II DNA/RNA helicase